MFPPSLRQSIPTLDIVLLLLHGIIAGILGVLLEHGREADLLQTGLHLLALGRLPARQRGGGVHLEAKDFRLVATDRLLGDQGRVDLKQDVLEGRAKVGAINVGVPARFGVVEVLAFATVELDGLRVGVVGQTGG